MSSRTTSPIITRLYQESTETDSCAEAIRLLLNFRENKDTGGRKTARDAAKEYQE